MCVCVCVGVGVGGGGAGQTDSQSVRQTGRWEGEMGYQWRKGSGSEPDIENKARKFLVVGLETSALIRRLSPSSDV